MQIPLAIFVVCVSIALYKRGKRPSAGGGAAQAEYYRQDSQDCEDHRGPQQQQRGPCTSCQLIEMGEMACYHGVCPNCGRVPNNMR